jgi:hypothetical protein
MTHDLGYEQMAHGAARERSIAEVCDTLLAGLSARPRPRWRRVARRLLGHRFVL